MEAAIVVAVSVYRFELEFLLSLDIFSLDRLMEVAKAARNDQVVEDAIAMRNAMNADKKEFEKFLKHYSNVPKEEQHLSDVDRSKAMLRKVFGG